MTNFLLFVAVLLLAYMAWMMHRDRAAKEEKKPAGTPLPLSKLLPDYLGKRCEFYVEDPMPGIDIMLSVTGVLADLDGDWMLLETETKKKKSLKLLRIENIRSVKEIKD